MARSTLDRFLYQLINRPINFLFQLFQHLLDLLLSPTAPPPNAHLGRPKIAIIGAGLTGVSSASHCVGHGFDVTIFEAGDRNSLGGIWAKVNNTSGLQIHSVMYRFHPSVQWSKGYPDRQQIVAAITDLWKRYGLQEKTVFDTKVEKVYKDRQDRWIVNNESNGRFDGVIACIGTCGDPKTPHIEGQENFKGQILHSSKLDGVDAKGKKVLVVGGGASAVEALEFASHGLAEKTYILARSEKWIIPRNPVIDILLALNIFGSETYLSWIPEGLLRLFTIANFKKSQQAADNYHQNDWTYSSSLNHANEEANMGAQHSKDSRASSPSEKHNSADSQAPLARSAAKLVFPDESTVHPHESSAGRAKAANLTGSGIEDGTGASSSTPWCSITRNPVNGQNAISVDAIQGHSNISRPPPPQRLRHLSELIDPAELPIDCHIRTRSGNLLAPEQFLVHPDRPLSIRERQEGVREKVRAASRLGVEMEKRKFEMPAEVSKNSGDRAVAKKRAKRKCCGCLCSS